MVNEDIRKLPNPSDSFVYTPELATRRPGFRDVAPTDAFGRWLCPGPSAWRPTRIGARV
jgi:hypothetical protein